MICQRSVGVVVLIVVVFICTDVVIVVTSKFSVSLRLLLDAVMVFINPSFYCPTSSSSSSCVQLISGRIKFDLMYHKLWALVVPPSPPPPPPSPPPWAFRHNPKARIVPRILPGSNEQQQCRFWILQYPQWMQHFNILRQEKVVQQSKGVEKRSIDRALKGHWFIRSEGGLWQCTI